MAEGIAIQIAYDRKALGRLIAVYSVLCILLLPMIIFLGGGFFYSGLTMSWPIAF